MLKKKRLPVFENTSEVLISVEKELLKEEQKWRLICVLITAKMRYIPSNNSGVA